MPVILALDQGTTSSRAIVFDREGRRLATAQREFAQIFPRPGWVEHDPEDIWASQMGVAIEALSRAGLTANDVAAIGITNQRETTIVWELATGRPVCNAIVWQDRRTAPLMERLRAEGADALIRERTGLEADAYFSASKAAWILENVAGARARAGRGELAFGTVDSWLVWKLTGGARHVTDASNASRTMLFNIHTGAWDDDLLALFGVPRAMLPEVCASSGVIGETAGALLARPIPIAGVAGDQQAALFGQMAVGRGMAKCTYGTGCFMLMNTGEQAVTSRQRLLTTVAWRMRERTVFALEGSVFIGGAVVQWLRDGLGLIRAAADVEALANSVADNGGVVFVPAFSGLGAPHWDQRARGLIGGLTRGATAGHIARAALESIAFQVADLCDAMRADSGVALPELRVDGGAAANNTLMQMQADILQAPVVRPAEIETTALGAAYLAGLGVGYWKDADELARQWKMERRFEPRMTPDRAAALRAQWSRAVERAKHWDVGGAD